MVTWVTLVGLRWPCAGALASSAVGGYASLLEFIPVAEKTGLIFGRH